jgi:hypothetical protein
VPHGVGATMTLASCLAIVVGSVADSIRSGSTNAPSSMTAKSTLRPDSRLRTGDCLHRRPVTELEPRFQVIHDRQPQHRMGGDLPDHPQQVFRRVLARRHDQHFLPRLGEGPVGYPRSERVRLAALQSQTMTEQARAFRCANALLPALIASSC